MRAHRIAELAVAAIVIAAGVVAQRDVASAAADAVLLHALNQPIISAGAFGAEVAMGDVNGDSMADTIVGAPLEWSGGDRYQGRAYAYSGADGSLMRTLSSPSCLAYCFFGSAVAAGDVDGDGKADIIVGARGDGGFGRVHVFSGADGALLYALDTPNPLGDEQFGSALAAADLSGDGKADIVVGTAETVGATTQEGHAYLFAGADGSLIHTFATPNPQPGGGNQFGASLAAGDVNGDGTPDVIVGAYGETVGANTYEGRAYVFSGTDGALLYTLGTPNPDAANFGAAVAAGDVNGDGKADIIVGAHRETVGANAYQGRAYVFSGLDGSLVRALDTPNPQASAFFGMGVTAGDLNGDGKADVSVGAYGESVNGQVNHGRAYAFSGATGSLLYTLNVPNSSDEAGAAFGLALASGDANGDGNAEVTVGADGAWDPNTGEGQAYVFTGVPGCRGDSDCDGCPDANEALLVPPTDPHNQWDFYSVPLPALLAAANPAIVFRDKTVGPGDAQAVFAYFKVGAKSGTAAYDQDLNLNEIPDGREYDRSLIGPGRSGAPDGVITAADAQLAFAQFKAAYHC